MEKNIRIVIDNSALRQMIVFGVLTFAFGIYINLPWLDVFLWTFAAVTLVWGPTLTTLFRIAFIFFLLGGGSYLIGHDTNANQLLLIAIMILTVSAGIIILEGRHEAKEQ